MGTTRTLLDQALDEVVDTVTSVGLTACLRELTRDVWANCLDRYEPDAFGDTHMGLAIQASENLQERAHRRFVSDDRERPEDHWHIDGLSVTAPKKVLTFSLPGAQILVMKTPMADGRSPQWENLTDWGHQSQARFHAAGENSAAMGGYKRVAHDTEELFSMAPPKARPLTYMYLWSGDLDSPLTSGWLAVPVLGDSPFAGIRPLWHDEEDDGGSRRTHRPLPSGPSFDERPVAAPELTIKRRPSAADGT